MDFTPIGEHFAAFGWAVREIDGNNMAEIVSALDDLPFNAERPSLVVAHTVKAKGLSFGENKAEYHFWTPAEGQLALAESELRAVSAGLEKELKEAESK